jgi:hypothetical protein
MRAMPLREQLSRVRDELLRKWANLEARHRGGTIA